MRITAIILWCVVAFLGTMLFEGCLSASSSTSAGSETSVKTQEKTSQQTTSTDKVKLHIDKTIIDEFDKDGKVIKRITIGGGDAETGSSSLQQSDIATKIDAQSKALAEAQASSKFNMTIIIIGIGVVLILVLVFSVLTRLAPLAKKLIKPI